MHRNATWIFLLLMALSWAREASAGDRYAFLVAVREYDKNELTSLQFTENDIQKLAETLLAAGYAKENVVVLTQSLGAQKTRFLPLAENIRLELALMLRELAPDDSIVVAFSGHGVQFKDEKTAFYCPADARLADRNTLISLGDVFTLLDRCKAGTKVLFVDACRNDPQSSRSKSAKEIELEAAGKRAAPVPPGGIAAFFSCSPTEESFEDPELGHGVFFHYVIDGLSGNGDLDKDGDVSLAELEQHVTKNVQRYVRNELRRVQTPERRGEARGLVSLAKVDAGKPAPGKSLPKFGDVIENSIGMKLVCVIDKPVEFQMGSPEDEEGREPDEVLHTVRLTRSILMGAYEVTQAEYQRVMGENPSYFAPTGKGAEQISDVDHRTLPVDSVSYEDAVTFCEQLSKARAETAAGRRYRLPTEAEWEYSCRAGSKSPYGVIGPFANRGSKGRTVPVGSYKSNPFGLFDTYGNVWEWCQDYYGPYPAGPLTDPAGPQRGTQRILRGGSWQDDPSASRAAYREHLEPTKRTNTDGLRVVCEIK
jgi:formylglycine-generating enzyme required for sulfatase activity